MKIAISASGKENSSLLDPRFGRCAFFAIYNSETKEWNYLPNPGVMEGSGAGVRAAQFLLEQKADVLLTGNLGPNASSILTSAGLKVFSMPEVTLEEAIKQYEGGLGTPITGATVDSHAGITRVDSSPETQQPQQQPEPPLSGKRIAIATDGTDVAQHFGRCQAYTLVDITDGGAENLTVIASPGHQPGFLPPFLAEKGVKCIISGGMGARAQNLFNEQGIDVIFGVTGPVAEVIASYLAGTLVGGESLCERGEGHGDGHRNC
jgi:predicted Fe-Mo cluster-binding NifX family protein